MQKDKKEAALGVTSTQSGNAKCDNISNQSVEQNSVDVKTLEMVKELVWLKESVEKRYTAGKVDSCYAYTHDDDNGAQASVSFTCAGELYTLTLRHEV
ncbi:hypothetical protein [Anaeromassilibacillus senegalensis]|uniref:hypothetical protein n=1 Tax=Anaeromassilibacillus senegalensis TaxID=1673717 RepID=UPI000681D0DD|nr:hypothetical protein [Anaeromassilibacillus senegalensis]